MKGDLELVVKQITREYKCIKGSLLKHFVTATQLLEQFEVTNTRHIPKNENQEANELAQIASGYKMSRSRLQDMIEVREKMVSNTPMTGDILGKNVSHIKELDEECQETSRVEEAWEHGVFAINNSSPTYWTKPIIEYLENPVGSTDRKTKYRALSYVWLGNEFLKKTP